jgi:hypothetical protein
MSTCANAKENAQARIIAAEFFTIPPRLLFINIEFSIFLFNF